jgi:hypothetical protein
LGPGLYHSLLPLSWLATWDHFTWNTRRRGVQRDYEGAWLLAETDDWQKVWKEKP